MWAPVVLPVNVFAENNCGIAVARIPKCALEMVVFAMFQATESRTSSAGLPPKNVQC